MADKFRRGNQMRHRKSYRNRNASLPILFLFVGIVCVPLGVLGQSRSKESEWPTYGADLGNTRYRPLDQINATNFSKMEVAWTFNTTNLGPRPEYKLEGTPLMVNGVMYTTAGSRRAAVAINPATGELLWMHSENEGE